MNIHTVYIIFVVTWTLLINWTVSIFLLKLKIYLTPL